MELISWSLYMHNMKPVENTRVFPTDRLSWFLLQVPMVVNMALLSGVLLIIGETLTLQTNITHFFFHSKRILLWGPKSIDGKI